MTSVSAVMANSLVLFAKKTAMHEKGHTRKEQMGQKGVAMHAS